MADGKEDDGNAPSQIPLLVDVVEPPRRPRKPRRPKKDKENYSLDLNPDPPQSLDLFSESRAQAPDATDAPDIPDVPKEDFDAELEAEMEARFHEQASELVDDLVRQYSQEIVRRLKEELSALLDDLDTGKSRQQHNKPGRQDPTDGTD